MVAATRSRTRGSDGSGGAGLGREELGFFWGGRRESGRGEVKDGDFLWLHTYGYLKDD